MLDIKGIKGLMKIHKKILDSLVENIILLVSLGPAVLIGLRKVKGIDNTNLFPS